MDNCINQIRRSIRALRVSMLEAEAIMREQVARDEDCAFVAGEVLKMRIVMRLLVQERAALGDTAPIEVQNFFLPRRAPFVKPPVGTRPLKRRLVSAALRA